ncbi:MAG: SIS domain-containing protein [Deltaproteobacteria bacterium]|nr:SIS domain-containing protein [Deltaproteobacteria bacterium]
MGDFGDFVDDYYRRFVKVLETFDRAPMEGVLEVLDRVRDSGGTVWVAGNGGSAAIADHTACDATKGGHVEGQPPLRIISLNSNVAMLTALSNDFGYQDVYRRQLDYYLKPGDAVLFVSSSGDSPNVVEACRHARDLGIPTIAFVGFGGGALRELAEHVVWVPVDNCGIAEDTHQSLMHVISQYLFARGEGPDS